MMVNCARACGKCSDALAANKGITVRLKQNSYPIVLYTEVNHILEVVIKSSVFCISGRDQCVLCSVSVVGINVYCILYQW